MPFCSNCGKEISKDTKFCPGCGQRLKEGFTLEERNKHIEELKVSLEGGEPPKKTKMSKKKLAGIIGGCIIAVIVIAIIATPGEPTPAPSPTESTVSTHEITLADAPAILDMSSELPARFGHLDAASEGMSNEDMGLGPEYSEIELFLREEPFQMVYATMTIVETKTGRAAMDEIIRDEEQLKSSLLYWMEVGFAEEGMEFSEVEFHVTYPSIGQLAVMVSGRTSIYGTSMGFEYLLFKNDEVYVEIYNTYYGSSLSLVPLANGINQRIEGLT